MKRRIYQISMTLDESQIKKVLDLLGYYIDPDGPSLRGLKAARLVQILNQREVSVGSVYKTWLEKRNK